MSLITTLYQIDTLLCRVSRLTSGIGRELAVIAIVLMMVLVSLNTIARALPFIDSLYFVEEYAGYLFVTLAFMGLADTFRNQGHIRVEILVQYLPRRTSTALELVVTLVATCIISILAWHAMELFTKSLNSVERAQTVTRTPLWIPRLFLVPGYCLLLIELLAHTSHCLNRLLIANSLDSVTQLSGRK